MANPMNVHMRTIMGHDMYSPFKVSALTPFAITPHAPPMARKQAGTG